MSDRPTPETDYMNLSNDCNALGFWLMTQHARKLELERDEAREALASREVVIAQQNVITDLILECNTAREALMKIEQIFIDSDDTYEDLIKMGNIARAVLETAK